MIKQSREHESLAFGSFVAFPCFVLLTGSSASGGWLFPPNVTSGAFGVTTGNGDLGLTGVVAGGLGFLYGLVCCCCGLTANCKEKFDRLCCFNQRHFRSFKGSSRRHVFYFLLILMAKRTKGSKNGSRFTWTHQHQSWLVLHVNLLVKHKMSQVCSSPRIQKLCFHFRSKSERAKFWTDLVTSLGEAKNTTCADINNTNSYNIEINVQWTHCTSQRVRSRRSTHQCRGNKRLSSFTHWSWKWWKVWN